MRAPLSALLGLALVSVTLQGGCSKAASGESGTPTPPVTDPGPPVNPDPTPTPTPRSLYYSGVYQANAALDFTQNGALPGLTSPALGVLANLHSAPGTAIVELGYAAGIDVLDSIGPTGRTLLGSILDGQLGNLYTNNPSLDRAVTTIQGIAQIAKTTVLQNSLTIHTPAADHTAKMELQVTGAQFHFVDVNLVDTTFIASVPAAALAAAKTGLTNGTVAARNNPNVAEADVTFDSGTVSIPMGNFLMQAIGVLVFQPLYGTSDFKTGFIDLIPCDSIATQGAAAVSSSGNPLLGALFTKPVLLTICTTAAGSLADQLIAQITAIKTDNVAISAGRGVLYDASSSHPTADYVADRIGDGTFSWALGSANIVSPLAGDRTATAP